MRILIYMLKELLSCKIMEQMKRLYILAMFLHSLQACVFSQWESRDARLDGYSDHFLSSYCTQLTATSFFKRKRCRKVLPLPNMFHHNCYSSGQTAGINWPVDIFKKCFL